MSHAFCLPQRCGQVFINLAKPLAEQFQKVEGSYCSHVIKLDCNFKVWS